MEQANKPEGLTKKLDTVIELMNKNTEDKKKKRFKLPFKIRLAKKSIIKNNRVMVFMLRANNNIVIKILEIDNDLVKDGDKVFDASVGFIFQYKGIPTMIIPEWSMIPVNTKSYYTDKDSRTNAAEIIIRAIANEEIAAKKKGKLGGKVWFFVIMAGLAIAYLLFGGSG